MERGRWEREKYTKAEKGRGRDRVEGGEEERVGDRGVERRGRNFCGWFISLKEDIKSYP